MRLREKGLLPHYPVSGEPNSPSPPKMARRVVASAVSEQALWDPFLGFVEDAQSLLVGIEIDSHDLSNNSDFSQP